MSRIIVASMIRNEAGRFLRSALAAWSDFADEIVILDDGSTDDSPLIAREAGVKIRSVSRSGAWGNEAPFRQALWDIVTEEFAKPGDWIFVLDADMVPARNPRNLLLFSNADEMRFPLYDLWHEHEDRFFCRADGFWGAALKHPRTWAVRVPAHAPAEGWKWNERGVHCGHFPLNLTSDIIGIAPRDFGLLHFAYSTPELRQQKFRQYESIAKQLTPDEVAHAMSILDPNPLLFPLLFEPEYRLHLESHYVSI